jgi:hypothetical protein
LLSDIELISHYASVIPITIISELPGVSTGHMKRFSAFVYSLQLASAVADSVLE